MNIINLKADFFYVFEALVVEDIFLMFHKVRDKFVGAPIFVVLDGSVAFPQILFPIFGVKFSGHGGSSLNLS